MHCFKAFSNLASMLYGSVDYLTSTMQKTNCNLVGLFQFCCIKLKTKANWLTESLLSKIVVQINSFEFGVVGT